MNLQNFQTSLNTYLDFPQTTENEGRRRLLNILLVSIFVGLFVSWAFTYLNIGGHLGGEDSYRVLIANIFILLGTGIIWLINWHDLSRLASWLLVAMLMVAPFADTLEQVMAGRALLMLTVPIFLASVLIHPLASFGVAGVLITILSTMAHQYGVPPNISGFLALGFMALISWLPAQSLRSALRHLGQSNQELDRRLQELTAVNAELQQFAYAMAHDLKAPMHGMVQLVEWLEEDLRPVMPNESRQHLSLLKRRVMRVDDLMDGIRDYLLVGQNQEPSEKVNVHRLIADVFASIPHPREFQLDIQPNLPTVFTKRADLSQVFTQLLSNAAKFHDKPNGRVAVMAEESESWITFTVQDDGPGIAPLYHEKIFHMFQTLEARDKIEGCGIGLALAQRIIQHWGGTLRVQSDLGQGTAFIFTWPNHTKTAVTSIHLTKQTPANFRQNHALGLHVKKVA